VAHWFPDGAGGRRVRRGLLFEKSVFAARREALVRAAPAQTTRGTRSRRQSGDAIQPDDRQVTSAGVELDDQRQLRAGTAAGQGPRSSARKGPSRTEFIRLPPLASPLAHRSAAAVARSAACSRQVRPAASVRWNHAIGVGRELSECGIREFINVRTVWINSPA
jgi:hypothetical protein